MANKKDSVEVLGTESANENTNLEVNSNNSLVTADAQKMAQLQNLFEMFEGQETGAMRSLTADYLEMKENSVYNFICSGMTTFLTSEGEQREAAILVDKENKTFINGGAVLVSSCKKLKEYPSLIRIITGDKVKSDKGKYLSMEIRTI